MPDWLTPALFVAALCGGLGGAVFTWWIKRERVASMGVEVESWTIEEHLAGKRKRRLATSLEVKNPKATHIHVVTIAAVAGYAKSGDFAVVMPDPKATILTYAVRAMSPLHTITVQPRGGNVLLCTITPCKRARPYWIDLETDSAKSPIVMTEDGRIIVSQVSNLPQFRASWAERLFFFVKRA